MKIQLVSAVLAIFMAITSMCMASNAYAVSAERKDVASWHAGFVYQNGVDVVGYTVERQLESFPNLFRYYTFGIPSFAAVGLSYYEHYNDNGFVVSAGTGIGFVLQATASYQLNLDNNQFIKVGAGYAAGVAYSGAIPVISYEYRMK